MVRMVLISPGCTDFHEQGRIQGVLNIPLNAQGAEEVARLSREVQDLGIEAVYTSECQAALETANALGASLGVKVKKLEQMQNLNHGLWQGMLVADVKKKHPTVYRQWQEQPDSICPPEGETLSAARKRVQGVLAKLLKKHKQGVVAIVAPEPLLSIARAELGCGVLGDLWRAESEHGHWEMVSVEPVAAKAES